MLLYVVSFKLTTSKKLRFEKSITVLMYPFPTFVLVTITQKRNLTL